MRSKTRTRGEARNLRLQPETATAIDDMMGWLESVTRGALWSSPQDKGRCLNVIIRAACEAVMNYAPHEHTSKCVNFVDGKTGLIAYSWPPAFAARAESHDEMELRVMLQRMSEGQDGETAKA